jgi:hypothetical protein
VGLRQANQYLESFWSSTSSISVCGFDDPLAISSYKHSLMTRWAFDEVSSSTVASVFQKLPTLRRA